MSQREMGHEPETIIAASVILEGDFKSGGNIIVEGTVKGSVTTQGDLRVGEQARIDANVVAVNAHISGEVKGNINISEKLELTSTAKVSGDVQTKILIVESGATINGHIVMGEGEEIRAPKSSGKIKDRIKEIEPEAAVEEKEKERRTINAFFTG